MLLQYDYYPPYFTLAYVLSWIIFFTIWLVIGFVLAYFVYKDAKRSRKKGMTPTMWAIIVFLTGLIGLVVYLLMKNAK